MSTKNKLKIEYVCGNLFDSIPQNTVVYIPHICNDAGRMGSGFVVPLYTKWPIVRRIYLQLFKENKNNKLGQCQFIDVGIESMVTVVNMIAQHGTISKENKKPIKYAALIKCMETVRNAFLDDVKYAPKISHQIICPKFGSKLAGGSWGFIEELINEIWIDAGIPVTVYYL